MPKETINAWNGTTITLSISSDGYCFCPVCGEKSKDQEWRPYDNEGRPSYDICSCGFEFGFDESGEPPYDQSWIRYRKKWLDDEVLPAFRSSLTQTAKLEQLKNLESAD